MNEKQQARRAWSRFGWRTTDVMPLVAVLLVAPCAVAEVDFNRDVRPILTKNCTTCHGGVKKAGEVSFLYREDVLGKGESGRPVVVPGDPDASEMIRRILTADPDDRMPPPDHHPQPLPKEEIEILTQWVRQGAEWGEHWAYQQPVAPEIPGVKEAGWAKSDMDRFILSKLESEGLQPAAEAEPAEWLRRVSLDLTGLPPTLEEFDGFQRAVTEGGMRKAMEQVVDRLLASDAYGEHWAAMWLDLARYSDTFGFEKDPHRTIWPWRDWVIRAFNEDMPYDEFTIKQLAGDLIPEPGPFDLVATAFHRNTQNNTEGGTDDEEWRMAAVIDRVSTTWTAWNGVTFGCVQCHDHPYDAIQHREFYQFTAFFNNAEDVDLNTDWPTTKVARDPSKQVEVVSLEKRIRQQREEINDRLREAAETIADWTVLNFDKAVVEPPSGKLDQQADGMVVSSGTTPNRGVFVMEAEVRPWAVLRVEIFPEQDDPAEWGGRGAVVSGLEAAYLSPDGKKRPIVLKEVVADFLAGPFLPRDSLDKGTSGFGEYPSIHQPRTAWFVAEEIAQPQPGERLQIRIRHGANCNESQSCILPRFRIAASQNGSLIERVQSSAHQAKRSELAALEKQLQAIPGTMMPVIQERSAKAKRATRVFIRGNRMTRGELVEPGIPALFGGDGAVRNRLEMAQWIVGKDNPLAARVLANRLWAQLFGIGIVETQEDFGSSGALPSHPELLDHLALRLRDHHQWHLKPFLRELALSATYGQTGRATPELLEKDPRNRLLARGPRQRLSAEMVRDQALVVAGLMTHQVGGAPVYPPQPEGVWNSVYSGAKWNTSTGRNRFRRAIYTYHKRTAGYPAYLTFDASARDVCLPRRISTNTPLQALVTLNDPAHIEFAQSLAGRMESAGTDLRDRLAHGVRLLTLADPEPGVVEMLAGLHVDLVAEYEKSPGESAKLASTPQGAALVLVANTLLNSDFALNR